MDVQALTFIFVGATFTLYIGIAIWARAGNTDDFYVAGGGVPPLANGIVDLPQQVCGNQTVRLGTGHIKRHWDYLGD